MSFLSSRLFGAAGRSVVAAATAAASAAAARVWRGGGGGNSGTAGAAAGAAGGGGRGGGALSDGAAEAERQVDEVVHVLSPGPLAQSEHSNPPTHEELAAAAARVKAGKEAWRRLRRPAAETAERR